MFILNTIVKTKFELPIKINHLFRLSPFPDACEVTKREKMFKFHLQIIKP